MYKIDENKDFIVYHREIQPVFCIIFRLDVTLKGKIKPILKIKKIQRGKLWSRPMNSHATILNTENSDTENKI